LLPAALPTAELAPATAVRLAASLAPQRAAERLRAAAMAAAGLRAPAQAAREAIAVPAATLEALRAVSEGAQLAAARLGR